MNCRHCRHRADHQNQHSPDAPPPFSQHFLPGGNVRDADDDVRIHQGFEVGSSADGAIEKLGGHDAAKAGREGSANHHCQKSEAFSFNRFGGQAWLFEDLEALGVLIPFEQFAALRNNQLLRNVLQITFDRRALPLEGFKSEHYF